MMVSTLCHSAVQNSSQEKLLELSNVRIIRKLSEGTICKYYQNSFCKFNQHCRNRHETNYAKNKIPARKMDASSDTLNFKEETSCIVDDGCAYKHKETNFCPPM